MHRFSLCLLILVAAAMVLPLVNWPTATADELSAKDLDGKAHTVVPSKESKISVLFFTAVECPMANRYTARVNDLAKTYQSKGAAFFVVYPNALEEIADVRKHAAEAAYPFPVLLDRDQTLADALKVETTPSVVVIGADKKVVYRGAIDNHKAEELVRKHYLRDALDAVLAGKPVAVASTEPVGCSIQRKLTAKADADVTYSGHVASILHSRCANCHRPGQVAPFSLLTYDQARRWATNIKEYTQARTMPPWLPANHGAFRAERWLPQEEIDTLARWADAGAPIGDAAKVPPPPKFPEGWALGTPDLILTAPEYDVAAKGPDEYRSFVLDPKLEEDRYVQAVEYRPGNTKVVHHCISYLDGTGASLKLDAQDPGPGYSTSGTGPGFLPLGDIGGWGPGMQPTPHAEGTALYLPKRAKIVMEVHYHKNGKPEKDRTQVGLYFSKTPVKKRVRSQIVLNMKFRLEPGDKRSEVKASWTSPEDRHAVAIIPHMHMIGKEIKVETVLPDGTTKTMVHVPNWDFNWQETYYFKEPFAIPKGARVNLTCWFDNSAENPNNPNNPPKAVRFGEQTTDEMAVAYIAYTRDEPD